MEKINISKKIKDEIEELKDTLKHYDEYSKLNLLERVNIDLIDSKIEILEELLKESEENNIKKISEELREIILKLEEGR